MTPAPIRVLIADDNVEVRTAMAALIESDGDLEFAAAATDAVEAAELAAREQPDVALVDMHMPGGGTEATRGIMACSPRTRIIALTAFSAPPEGLDTEAVGCILKGSPIDFIVDSIKRAAGDGPLPSWESVSNEIARAGGPGLAEGAELIEGFTATSPLENSELVDELQASRARIVAAVERERIRLERHLHDGVQQRLLAIQIKLAIAREQAGSDELATQLDEIAADAATAVDELRALAHRIYPTVLRERGLPAALRALGKTALIEVSVVDDGIGRHSPEIEAAIYFCSLEAIQNSIKHGGPDTHVIVKLRRRSGGVAFEVEDDGAGFHGSRLGHGIGLVSMRDRIGAVGGELVVSSHPGEGTSICAFVPEVVVESNWENAPQRAR